MKRVKETGMVFAVVTLSVLAFFVTALLGSGQASEESEGPISESWVCPVDEKLTKDECDWVTKNDPLYLSEEDAMENFGKAPSGPGVLAANSCSYDSGTKVVTCEGDDNENTIQIGKTSTAWFSYITICIQGVASFGYLPSTVSYVKVLAYAGDDVIDVRETSITCQLPGSSFTLYPFDSAWSAYLVAYGGDGSEEIKGSPNGDTLSGQNHSDLIYGRGGSDYIYGGANAVGFAEYLYCGGGSDHVYGGAGTDVILCTAGTGTSYLYGETGYDYTYGSEYNDYINDLSHGATDGNWMNGYDGDDNMVGDYGDDYMIGDDDGDQGEDTIRGYDGDDTIYGGKLDDHLYGGNGEDKIVGQGGLDYIEGGANDDCIIGDYEDATPDSDDDSDTIYAGTGNDCVYCDSVVLGSNCAATEADSANDNDYAHDCDDDSPLCGCTTGGPAYCNNPI